MITTTNELKFSPPMVHPMCGLLIQGHASLKDRYGSPINSRTHDPIKSEFEDIPISTRIFDDSTEGKIELGRHPLQKIFATTPMSKLMKLLRADVSLIFLKGLE